MSATDQQREIALRIGLAARALPETSPERLVAVLKGCVNLPLTTFKLEKLTLEQLKSAADGALSALNSNELEAALAILKTSTKEAVDKPKLPEIEPYQEDDMPSSIRVAVATNDAQRVDGHFGSCEQFLIYQLTSSESRLIDIRSIERAKEKASDDKNSYRSSLIKDCHVLYVCSVGGPAAAKVVKAGLHPIKMPNSDPISDVIENLKNVLTGSPPPWLAKVMGHDAEARVRFALEED